MAVSCLHESKAYDEMTYYDPNNISTMKGLALLASIERIVIREVSR